MPQYRPHDDAKRVFYVSADMIVSDDDLPTPDDSPLIDTWGDIWLWNNHAYCWMRERGRGSDFAQRASYTLTYDLVLYYGPLRCAEEVTFNVVH